MDVAGQKIPLIMRGVPCIFIFLSELQYVGYQKAVSEDAMRLSTLIVIDLRTILSCLETYTAILV